MIDGYVIKRRRDVGGSGGVPLAEVPWQLCEGSQQRSPQNQCLERSVNLSLSFIVRYCTSELKSE